MREGEKILSLPVNAVRAVHHELLASDPEALLAYLMIPPALAFVPPPVPPDVISIDSLLRATR